MFSRLRLCRKQQEALDSPDSSASAFQLTSNSKECCLPINAIIQDCVNRHGCDGVASSLSCDYVCAQSVAPCEHSKIFVKVSSQKRRDRLASAFDLRRPSGHLDAIIIQTVLNHTLLFC